MENPAILLRRLNPYCARAMEGAASLCQTRAHAEILPEHWLLKLLEQGEGDLTVLARRYEWDMDTIWQDMLGFLDSLPRSVRSRPQLSEGVQSLMQDAWLHASLAGEEHIRSIHLLMALVEKPKLLRCDGLWPLLTLAQSQLERLRGLLDAQSDERPEVQQEAELTQGDEVDFVGRPVNADIKGELNPALQNALDRFTLDVTARAREGRIDPVYGRDNEIRQMVDILSRRRKNNPILVGEPGVGKTALVEGLALRIHEGNVPDALKPVSVRTLDLGLLQAGAGVKGEFEQRLKNIIDAVQQSPLPVLLFIDEAHTIIGAGNQAGGADAANLLKPALARGELRTIAATTWSEYKQYFERDAALERRFQMVKVDEPDDDTACLMLRGLKSRYAEHHGVHITDEAVKAAGQGGGFAGYRLCPYPYEPRHYSGTADPHEGASHGPCYGEAGAAGGYRGGQYRSRRTSGRHRRGRSRHHFAARRTGSPVRPGAETDGRTACLPHGYLPSGRDCGPSEAAYCRAAEYPAAGAGCGRAYRRHRYRRLDRRTALFPDEGRADGTAEP